MPGTGRLWFRTLGPCHLGKLAKPVLPPSLGWLYISLHDAPIYFFDRMVLKLFRQAPGRLRVAGEEDNAGDGPVEAMRDAEINVAWLVVAFLKICLGHGLQGRSRAEGHSLGQ